MNIGDLFMRAVVDDTGFAADLKTKAGKAGDQAGLTLGQRLSAGLKNASKGLTAGLGLGAGVAAFSALDSAISTTIGFLGDAVKAAMEDQESQNRLAASLHANVQGWNGNTDAIEKNILAKQRLGFSDEVLRDSLTVLVGATHDVGKAQTIMNTAMDLARFKGIDLKTASEALIKVEGGHYRSLVQLGIKLKEGATQQDALNAVQAVAQGQAEAYAETLSGKLEAAQIHIGESMEDLGRNILPLVAEGLDAIVRGLDPLSVSFDETAAAAARGSQAAIGRLDAMKHKLEEIPPIANAMKDAVKDDFAAAAVATRPLTYATERVGFTAEEAAKKYDEAMKDIVGSVARAKGELETAASDVAHAIFDPIAQQRELDELDRQRKQQQQIIDDQTTGAAERAESQKTLTQIQMDTIEVLAKLAAAGDAEAAARLQAFVASAKASGHLSAQQIADLNKLLLKINAVKLSLKQLQLANFMSNASKDDTRAMGGPVVAGHPYLVNENTPNSEVWVPSVSGEVLGPSATPAGGGHTINIYNPEPRAADADMGRQLRRLEALGL